MAKKKKVTPVVPVMPPTRLAATRSTAKLRRQTGHAAQMYDVLQRISIAWKNGGDIDELAKLCVEGTLLIRKIDNGW